MYGIYYIGIDDFGAIVSDCTIDSYLDDLVKDRFMSLDGIAMDSEEMIKFVRGCTNTKNFEFLDEDSGESLYLTRLDSESFQHYILIRAIADFPLIIDLVGTNYRKYLPYDRIIRRKWEKITGFRMDGSF